MKHRYLACLVLLVAITSLLAACGGDGGGGAPAPVPSVTLSATYPDYFTGMPETFALANNTDTVTITAVVKNADGTPATDGTPVTFAAPAGSTLSSTSAVTSGGTASVTVTHAAVTAPAANVTVAVTASALGVSSSVDVKFINQPASVDVFVALTPSLAGVEAVQLGLQNTAGGIASPPNPPTVAINAGAGALAVTGFDAANNTSGIVFLAVPGINTVALSPIVQITYVVTVGAGVPDFTPIPHTTIGAFIIAGAGGATLLSPSPTALNFAVTFKFNTE